MKKKIFAALLATVMTVASVVPAFAAEYDAVIGFADADWSYQDWASSVKVNGEGTYTVTATTTAEAPAETALVFVVDIGPEGGKAAADFASYELKDVKVKVDGTEVAVDMTKVLKGDIEEKGKYRIELYNEYGATKDAPAVDPAVVKFSDKLEVTFTLNDPTNDTPVDTPQTGDMSAVLPVAVLAVAAMAVVVVMKKRTVAE